MESFGSTYNGVISSITQFMNAISLLTLGVAGATRLALYKTLANDDLLGTSRVVKANKIYMRRVALCVIGYVILLCIFYPFISHSELEYFETRILVLIVGISIFARYFFSVSNQTLLSSDQSDYINSIVLTITIIINTIVIYVLVKAGTSVFLVKFGSSIVFFISPVVLNILVSRRYKLIKNCDADFTAIEQKGTVAFHSVANIIHNNTDLVILTLFADAKVVSVYTVYYLVAGKIKDVLQVFTGSIESAFGNMWQKKEVEAFEQGFDAFEYVIYLLVTLMISCVGILIIPFIKLYTDNVHDINYVLPMLAILIVFTEYFYCLREPYQIIVQATGNYEGTKKNALIETVMNVLVSLVLVQFIGIYGVIVGTLISNIYRTVVYIRFIDRHVIYKHFFKTVKLFLWSLACIVISFCIDKIFSSFTATNSWKMLLAKAIVTFVISFTIIFISSLLLFKKRLLLVIRAMKGALRLEK